MEKWFVKDVNLLNECGYEEVDYSKYEFTKNQRVFVYIQAGTTNGCGDNSYGYIEAVAKSTGIKINFESKKQYFNGYRWTNDIYDARCNKVIVTKSIIENTYEPRIYTDSEKKEIIDWYNGLSYGNRKAVDKII
mgnify:CR=1 FL=1